MYLPAMDPRQSVTSVEPAAGIPGGEVRVRLSGVTAASLKDVEVQFGGASAHLVSVNTTRALALVPDLNADDPADVCVIVSGADASNERGVQFKVGKRVAQDLHPVANPAFDPGDGSLFVTRSGSRGEHVPVSIFRIDRDGVLEDFSGEVTNPTGIAFDRTGRMFVTSRFDGTVYRLTREGPVVAFAADLGIATGVAFNREGEMFVGDRSGTIYRIN